MTTRVTRYDFYQDKAKYMKMAETETVLIMKSKCGDVTHVLMPVEEYGLLTALAARNGVSI